MTQMKRQKTEQEKEYIAELLKERIYATLALLAVLISIDSSHTDPLHAVYIVTGTIVSLWAASIVATQMSRRLVFKGALNAREETKHQLRRHAPMLAALIFPLLMISLAMLNLIGLDDAINVSILSALALLVGWSIDSARSLGASKLPTFILVVVELSIGLAVVGLKIVAGH